LTEGDRRTPSGLWILIALLAVMWSANFIFAKIALRELPPFTLALIRFSMAGMFILPVYLWKKGLPQADPVLRRYALICVTLVGINQLAFVLGLNLTSVAHSALILSTSPIWVLLMSKVVGHEQIRPSKLVGLGIAVAGVGVLQWNNRAGHESSVLGDALVWVASLSWSAYTVASKSARAHLDGLTMNTITYGGTALAFLPLTVWLTAAAPLSSLSAAVWASLLYMAVFPTLIGVAIYYHAMRYMPASRISMVSYAQPVLATVFAVSVLGESFSKPVAIGGALVLAGVIWTERA